MRNLSSALTMGLCCLGLVGCLELVRRPTSDREVLPADLGSLPPVVVPQKAEEDLSKVQIHAAKRSQRTQTQAEAVRQVNQYALWCLDHGLWNEARSHLERALVQDSLSASLHNNLAIVYEHFGLHQQAAELYRRAQALNPQNKIYRANLQRLEQFQQAATDTTGKIDIFDSRQRMSGPQREPFQQIQPRLISDRFFIRY